MNEPINVSGKKYLRIGLKVVSLGFVIAAGTFWARASMDSRPKYRDEQTLVGGTIWSQIIVPFGLFISRLASDKLDVFVEAYFLGSGVVLLFATGIVLVVGECLPAVKLRRRRDPSILHNLIVKTELKYDKIYFCIGLLSIVAGCFKLADFILLLN